MAPTARRALRLIRRCVEESRFILTTHFSHRMDERGLVWPDVLAAIDEPSGVRFGGLDEIGRHKWIIAGRAADGLEVELVCIWDEDDNGDTTILVTMYWERP
jgi:hypothetical protein